MTRADKLQSLKEHLISSYNSMKAFNQEARELGVDMDMFVSEVLHAERLAMIEKMQQHV